MKITTRKLRDERFGSQWRDEIENRWDYADFKRAPKWRNGWISFDNLAYCPVNDSVYCGITSFAGDIFKAYDRKTGSFLDLGFGGIADEYDAKIHRSFCWGDDGSLYAAIALLHCIDRYYEAPGGAVLRIDPRGGVVEKLGIPAPHVYLQSLVLDPARKVFYGLGFHPQCLVRFDLATRAGRILGYITSGYGGGVMSENLALDDSGCVWSNWGMTRAWQYSPGPDSVRLCKYDPREDRLMFFQRGLPVPGKTGEFAPVESFHNFGDGCLYAGAHNGSLYRIDPETAAAEYLCNPVSGRRSRLAALAKAGDGVAYGIVGRDGQCELARFLYREGRAELLGPILDKAGNALWQCHDLALAPDGVLFAGENDNPFRSGRLWEIEGF